MLHLQITILCLENTRLKGEKITRRQLPISRSELVSVAKEEFGLCLMWKYLLRACVQGLVLNF